MSSDGKEHEMGAASTAEHTPTPTAAGLDDSDVRALLAAGDARGALVMCARRHGHAIGRLCMALCGAQQDAEDVAQETFLDAFAVLPSWRGDGSVRSFLYAIARRKCARLLERRASRTARLRLVHDAERELEADAEERLALLQRAERARSLLDTVRPSEREALLLRYGAELSFREVAEACGIDEAAARKRVSRAMARLRMAFADIEPSQETP